MDVSALSTIKKSEEGSRLYFKNTATGEQLDVFIEMLGQDSQKYLDLIHKNLVSSVNKKKKEKIEEEDLLKSIETQNDILYKMVTKMGDHEEGKRDKNGNFLRGKEIDGIQWNDRKLKANYEDVKFLFDNIPDFKEQARAFMENRANFL